MADAAISVSSSVLATLLATASGDQPTAGASTAGKPTDPFAALLATVAADKPQPLGATKSDRARTPDAVAALLAGTAVVPATATATPAVKINPAIVPQPTGGPVPPAADMPAIETDETTIAPKSDESGDDDDRSDDKGKDPLADAIASGATAVLALAPAIVAPPLPVAVPVKAAVSTPVGVGSPTAPVTPARLASVRTATLPHDDQRAAPETGSQPVTSIALPSEFPEQSQLAALPVAHATQLDANHPLAVQSWAAISTQAEARAPKQSKVPVQIQSQTPDASAIPVSVERLKPASAQHEPDRSQSATTPTQRVSSDPSGPSAARSDAQPAKSQAPTSPPAQDQLAPPTEAARPVVALLQQDDTAPPSGESAPAAPIEMIGTKPEVRPAAQPAAARQPHGETPPAQAPMHRRAAEAPSPRRPADTRRRADVAASDTSITAATQRAPEPPPTSESAGFPAASAKGDTVVQQTLTIARDGAWLDRLARDIASAGNGGDLQFKLDPERLGSLSVAITHGGDGVSIRLTADNDVTRNLLLDAQPKLLAEARAQGLKISDTRVDLNQNQNQNQTQGQNQQGQQSPQGQHQPHAQTANQDLSRWAQGGSSQNSGAQNGQNRQSSPGHQPFVSNLMRKAEADSESSDGDSGALYA